jgi:hypothetical protein
MQSWSSEHLTIDALDDAELPGLRLRWLGRCTERFPQRTIGPYLRSAVVEAQSRGVTLGLDFRRLDSLNSSTISTLMHVLREAQGKSVRQVLFFDVARVWQRSTRDALLALTDGNPLLEIRG